MSHESNRQLRIIFVDDDPSIREVIPFYLETTVGVPVDTAENGCTAWAMIEPGAYDLCIVDLDMPVMDGLGLIGRIREANLPCKVIVFTGNDTGPHESALQLLRVDKVVSHKTHLALLKAVREILTDAPGPP